MRQEITRRRAGPSDRLRQGFGGSRQERFDELDRPAQKTLKRWFFGQLIEDGFFTAAIFILFADAIQNKTDGGGVSGRVDFFDQSGKSGGVSNPGWQLKNALTGRGGINGQRAAAAENNAGRSLTGVTRFLDGCSHHGKNFVQAGANNTVNNGFATNGFGFFLQTQT